MECGSLLCPGLKRMRLSLEWCLWLPPRIVFEVHCTVGHQGCHSLCGDLVGLVLALALGVFEDGILRGATGFFGVL